MENLIGKKVRGFKFENLKHNELPYAEHMNPLIGVLGTIISYNTKYNSYRVTFNDNENDYWQYPSGLIHEHLVEETELRKVWAWDNDPQEAFETYLIKEFEGFEYTYLCIQRNCIELFEDKEFVHTDFMKHISETDPRVKNDVIKLVEKYGKDRLITLIEKI